MKANVYGTTSIESHTASLAALRAELARRGLFAPDPIGVARRAASLVVATVGGALLALCSEGAFALLIGAALSAMGGLGLANIAHNASHRVTGSQGLDDFFSLLGHPLAVGLSATSWRSSHSRHHAAPNHVNHDPDVNPEPVVTLRTDVIENASPVLRRWYRYGQPVALPLIVCLIAVNMLRQGFTFLARALRDPVRRQTIHVLDAAVLSLHPFVWIALPSLLVEVERVLLFYGLRIVLLGIGVFSVVTPAHAQRPLTTATPVSHDHALRQTTTTSNFRAGPLARWVMCGLDLHVEHHLFPRIPFTRLPAASGPIREFLAGRGLELHEMTWREAIGGALRAFVHRRTVVDHLVASPVTHA